MNSLFRFKPLLAVATAVVALMTVPAFAAPTLSISGPSSVAAGGTLQLSVFGSGFADLYAYQFDLSFNPAAFAVAGVTEGALLAGAGSTFFDGGTADNLTGTVSFIFNTLVGAVPGASGSGDLAEFTFNVGAGFIGSGSFAITNVMALDSSLNLIDVLTQGAAVSVVPEPSSLALAFVGLGLCLSGAQLKRRAKPEAAAAF